MALWLQVTALGRAPHVDDEATYLFQAEALRHGALWGPASPFGVQVPFTLVDGDRLAGVFPNGWPAVLAAATAGGLPWWGVNPLLLVLLVWRGAALAGAVGGARATLPAALLLALSPQLLVLGASGMSHTLVALCWVVCWDLSRRPATAAGDLGLGLVLGLCALTRPLCGLVLAATLLVVRPRPLVRWLRVAAPLGLAVGIQLWQNRALTGAWGSFAANAWFDQHNPAWPGSNALGFGPNRGHMHGVEGHDLTHAWNNTIQNISAWNQLLLGPWLLFLPLLALWRRDTHLEVARWLFGTLVLVAAYGLYWYAGTCYGARFYHGAAPLLLVAVAVGCAGLPSRPARHAILGLSLVSQALALAGTLPELRDYRGLDGRLAAVARTWRSDDAVVLVTATTEAPRSRTPRTGPAGVYYQPDLASRLGPVAATWPDASVWFAAGNDQNYALAQATGRAVWLLTLGAQTGPDRLERLDAP